MEERILEAMEHTGLDLGEEEIRIDWREMLTNQQEEHHGPSGSISSQWAVEMHDPAAGLSGNHPDTTQQHPPDWTWRQPRFVEKSTTNKETGGPVRRRSARISESIMILTLISL